MPFSFLFLFWLLLINQNFASRLVLLAPVTTTLHLSWKIFAGFPLCIKYTDTCMRLNAINGSGPVYLSELQRVYTPSRTSRSSSFKDPHLPFLGKNNWYFFSNIWYMNTYKSKQFKTATSHLLPAFFFLSFSFSFGFLKFYTPPPPPPSPQRPPLSEKSPSSLSKPPLLSGTTQVSTILLVPGGGTRIGD